LTDHFYAKAKLRVDSRALPQPTAQAIQALISCFSGHEPAASDLIYQPCSQEHSLTWAVVHHTSHHAFCHLPM